MDFIALAYGLESLAAELSNLENQKELLLSIAKDLRDNSGYDDFTGYCNCSCCSHGV